MIWDDLGLAGFAKRISVTLCNNMRRQMSLVNSCDILWCLQGACWKSLHSPWHQGHEKRYQMILYQYESVRVFPARATAKISCDNVRIRTESNYCSYIISSYTIFISVILMTYDMLRRCLMSYFNRLNAMSAGCSPPTLSPGCTECKTSGRVSAWPTFLTFPDVMFRDSWTGRVFLDVVSLLGAISPSLGSLHAFQCLFVIFPQYIDSLGYL